MFRTELLPAVTEVIPQTLFIQCLSIDKMHAIYNHIHTVKAISFTLPFSNCNFHCILTDPLTTLAKNSVIQ
jgi:hypothetical protein